jgi:glutathione S-transferase
MAVEPSSCILHHFPQSPFSEKVRLISALKNIAWTSVLISRIMPQPDLMPLTGGYRRTPVMQIGAHIYCDTECIINELERRFPQPTLFPKACRGLGSATTVITDLVGLLRGGITANRGRSTRSKPRWSRA